MEKKTKYIWYLIAICCLILFALILISSLIDIGEKLRQIHWSVEVVFYCICALLIFFGIINPIRIIMTSPDLKIVTSFDQDDPRIYKTYKMVAKNIVQNNELPEESQTLLTNYQTREELLINLQYVFQVNIKKGFKSYYS